MTMTPLQDIENDTEASAAPVQFNFQTLETYINTEVISRDGSVQMTGPLILADGQPAASAAAVSGSVPIGAMIEYIANSEPTNWKLCNGQVLNVAAYPELAAVIGTTFNLPGDNFGGTQFRLPDFRQRVSVGFDPATGPFNTVGGTVGEANWELIQHLHTINHGHTATSGNQDTSHTHTINHGHTASSANDTHGHTYSAVTFDGSGIDATGGAVGGWTEVTGNDTHNHAITVNSHSGSSGNQSASHQHTITVNNHSGNSGNAGTATVLTNRNYPPSVVVTKLIKVK